MPEYRGYELPEELYYTTDHAWIRLLGDGRLQMGLTDFTQAMAGPVTFVQLPKESKEVEANLPIFSFQSAKWVGWIKPAAKGVVFKVNDRLIEEPALVNKDPYGDGWVVVIEPTEPAEEVVKGHLQLQEAVDWLDTEIIKHGG